MSTRHFLRDDDLTPDQQREVLDAAKAFKADRFRSTPLAGPQTVALLFDKPSTRTRVSFAVAVAELGGMPLVIDGSSSQLGRGEPVADTARVLTRQVAAIAWRTFAQADLAQLAAYSTVPVVNALTDEFHPCQLLADLLTIIEHKGDLAELTLAYLGDGANNMAHSYLLGCATAGMAVRIGTPRSAAPDPRVVARAGEIARRTGGSVQVLQDPVAAADGADVLATDTWVSMGHEDDKASRTGSASAFAAYAIDPAALARAAGDAIVLHCLPAYRGLEISASVIDGAQSVVWDEAENRMHAQKALLAYLLEQS